MQHSQTSHEQEQSWNTQNSVNTDNNSNSTLIEREKIPNTPFWIVGNTEIGYKLTWGKYTFMDEPAKTIDEAYIWYTEHPWEITMHLIAIGFKISDDAIKNTKEQGSI